MKESESSYALWRRVHQRLRNSAELETVTEEANALLPRLEEAEDGIRSLIKQNAHLSKTLVDELKNLAADFDRQAAGDRSALGQKLGEFQKAFEQKNLLLKKDLGKQLQQQLHATEDHAVKLQGVVAQQNDLLDNRDKALEQKVGALEESFEQKNGQLQKQLETEFHQQRQAAEDTAGKLQEAVTRQNDLLEKQSKVLEQKFRDMQKAFEQKLGSIEKSFDQKGSALQKQFEKNLQQQQQAGEDSAGKVLGVITGQNERLDKERKAVEQRLGGIEKSFDQKNSALQKQLEQNLRVQQQATEVNAGKLLDTAAKQNDLLDRERKAVKQNLGEIQQSFEEKNRLLQKEFDKQFHQLQVAADANSGKLLDVVARQNELLKQEQRTMAAKLDQACGAVAGVGGSLAGVQEYIAEQGQAQRRYREGYDFQILKNFAGQLAQVIDNLEKQVEKAKGTEKQELETAREGLIDLLARNGVEQVAPAVGAVYDDAARESAEEAGTVEPSGAAQAGTIAEVVRPAYQYTLAGGEAPAPVLRKAKVKIYCAAKPKAKKTTPAKAKSESATKEKTAPAGQKKQET